jgi:hypothetical protein
VGTAAIGVLVVGGQRGAAVELDQTVELDQEHAGEVGRGGER